MNAPRDFAPADCQATGKRAYRSKRAAMAAHRFAGFRVRVYPCKACGYWHATNSEKEHR